MVGNLQNCISWSTQRLISLHCFYQDRRFWGIWLPPNAQTKEHFHLFFQGDRDIFSLSRQIRHKRERPVAWGTTGLPWEPAWVWDIEALGCVGRGLRWAAWGAAGGLCL